jgi:hypothetical protein
LERKPGATRETWQLGFVKNLGPKMAEYVELVRQGPRSLKYELSRLVALVTVYGEPMVLEACADCLKAGIVGVDNVELYLKRRHHPSGVELSPRPITFESEKLNRIHRPVDLRKYDALLFEVDQPRGASKEKSDGNRSNDGQPGAGREPVGIEAQILGSGRGAGSSGHGYAGSGTDLTLPASVDLEGKVRAPHADDPESDPKRKIPPTSDSGKL